MTKAEELVQIKSDLSNIYNNICYCCGKKCKKSFTFHHIIYVPSEKIYSDFTDQLEYYRYLAPIISAEPDRFLLLHNKCHYAVEQLKRYGTEKLNRLIEIVFMSK